MKIIVTTLAYDGNGRKYARLVARMIGAFKQFSPQLDLMPFVGCFPPSMPEAGQLIVDGWDYAGYIAKPFCLRTAMDARADIALWLDASILPIADIQPLIDFIADKGYYWAPAGFTVGQWTSGEMLASFEITRDEALKWPDVLSGCVGLDLRRREMVRILKLWSRMWEYFPGHHSNVHAETQQWAYRNLGFVSHDPRCLGHRHDQSALSILAHDFRLPPIEHPRFLSYGREKATKDTVLVVEGA